MRRGLRTAQVPTHLTLSDGRRGSALVLSLVAVTVVTTIGIAYLGLSATTSRRLSADLEAQQAFYLAEAGLAEAFQAVRIGRTGEIGSFERPATYGNGLLWVAAEDTSDQQVRLECTAMVGSGRTVLAMTVEPVEEPLGFFADQDLVVESVLLVDGFNSDNRTYVEEVALREEPSGEPDPTTLTEEEQTLALKLTKLLVDRYGESLMVALVDPDTQVWFDPDDSDEPVGWSGGGSAGSISYSDYLEIQVNLSLLQQAYPNGWTGFELQPVDADVLVDSGSLDTVQTDGTLTTTEGTSDTTSTVSTTTTEGTTGAGGLLGSNADVVFLGSTGEPVEIFGDVVPGPEGAIVGGGDLTITGETDPRPEAVELPEVEVPAIALEPAVVQDGLLPMVVPPGEAGFEGIDVAADAELILTGPATVVIGQLTLAPGALLTLDTRDGPVDLYVTGGMDLAQGSLVETTSLFPDELSVQVAAQPDTGDVDVRLEATSQFHGVIYAPEANVRIGSDFEVFGSVAARRLEIAAGARLHFDSARYTGTPIPKLVSWRILELPAADSRRGLDPFRRLGLDPADLPPLDEAHDLGDVKMFVSYRDASGADQEWYGAESDFSWKDVGELVDVERTPVREQCDDESATGDTSDWSDWETWWEEPSDFTPDVRKGVSVIAMTGYMWADEDLTAAVIDLSPLNVTEFDHISHVIQGLPSGMQDQIYAAQ